MRVWLSRARADSLAWPTANASPDDALLKTLYEGTFAYYNGKFKRAGEQFDEADRITEARYTKSVSQNALAMLTNDRELNYEPGINERLLMHYYGALAFLGDKDLEGAAVEARKLAYLLQKYEGELTDRDRPTRTMLRWFAGAVFESTGERNDALVSYRNARALGGEPTPGDDDERLGTDGLSADSGDVLLVVEQGFVAFPVPLDISVPLYQHEASYFRAGGTRDREAWMSGRVGLRIHAQLAGSPGGGLYVGQTPAFLSAGDEWGMLTAGEPGDVNVTYRAGNQYGYRYDPRWGWRPTRVVVPDRILKLSVPVYRVPRNSGMPVITSLRGPAVTLAQGNVSEAEVADFDRERGWTYARAVMRVAVKAIAADAAEAAAKQTARDKKKGEKEDKNAERWGRVFGFLASAAGAALERADTRAWNLLPDRITLVRLRLPAGKQNLTISAPRMAGHLELRDVDVRPGRLTVATTRLWGSEDQW